MEMYIFPCLGRAFTPGVPCILNLWADRSSLQIGGGGTADVGDRSIDRSIVITFVTTPRFKWNDNLAQQTAVAVYISFTIAEMEFMGLISEVE